MLDPITDQERKRINQLKERVLDELPEKERNKSDADLSFFLVRWLRARNGNVDKATEMLRSFFKWRLKTNADHVLEEAGNSTPLFGYGHSTGPDKEGHPVFLMHLGDWDYRTVKSDPDSLKAYDSFLARFFEDGAQLVWKEHLRQRPNNFPVTQATGFVDVGGFAYGQVVHLRAIKRMIQMASCYESCYPDLLNQVHFINCPPFMPAFFRIVRPFLTDKTYGKFRLYTTREQWEQSVKDIIDPSHLPHRYGGTLAD